MTSVAVVIPVWNRATIVGRAIDSVLAQDYPGGAVSVNVVDDGSTDNLAQVLSAYGERVTCLRCDGNAGAAAARNAGVMATGADYVAFLDSDDAWLPGKLTAQIGFMREHGYAASCTAFELAREGRGTIVAPGYATGALTLSDLVWGCFVSPGSTLVFRRDIFAEVGVFDTALGRLEDWDWLLRYTYRHRLGFLAEPLARITASVHANAGRVLSAIEVMRNKHAAEFVPADRRHFAAALDFERAAALYRSGEILAALPPLLTSLCRSPLGHPALTAVLHNRVSSR